MPEYRRRHVPGGSYFFTVNLEDRESRLLVEQIDILRGAYHSVCKEHPFTTRAIVILPDHIHAVWTLPPGDANFSTRWKKIKARFSRALHSRGLGYGVTQSPSRISRGETGPWQRRFWEHTIRDQADLAHHIAYCHNNPVWHGLVSEPEQWPYSSIKRCKVGANPPAVSGG